MENLISLKDISKTYQMGESEVVALERVNLGISPGGIVALMGPSGSGKSTILNLIGALDSPTQGDVVVNGVRLAGMSRNESAEFRSRSVGFIFQTFNLVPVLTTIENIMLPSYFTSEGAHAQVKIRAIHLLERVGLSQQIHQSVNKLSGGQMQRVAIARALINRPTIILADEPTANLDRKNADNVLTKKPLWSWQPMISMFSITATDAFE
jgi:putative ABC transport system ATP-binding protein